MKTLIQLAFGLIGIGLLTGCGNEVDHTEIRKGGFVFCGQSNLKTFNPQLIDSGITADALSPQIYDTLLTLNHHTPTDREYCPGLAGE